MFVVLGFFPRFYCYSCFSSLYTLKNILPFFKIALYKDKIMQPPNPFCGHKSFKTSLKNTEVLQHLSFSVLLDMEKVLSYFETILHKPNNISKLV